MGSAWKMDEREIRCVFYISYYHPIQPLHALASWSSLSSSSSSWSVCFMCYKLYAQKRTGNCKTAINQRQEYTTLARAIHHLLCHSSTAPAEPAAAENVSFGQWKGRMHCLHLLGSNRTRTTVQSFCGAQSIDAFSEAGSQSVSQSQSFRD